jgi:hypothetical protein
LDLQNPTRFAHYPLARVAPRPTHQRPTPSLFRAAAHLSGAVLVRNPRRAERCARRHQPAHAPIVPAGVPPTGALRPAHLSMPPRHSALGPRLAPSHAGWAARHLAPDPTDADKAAAPSPIPAPPRLPSTLPIVPCSAPSNHRRCACAYWPPPPIGRASDISPSARCARDILSRPASIRRTSHSSASPRPHTELPSPSFHSRRRSSEFFHR